MYTYIVNERYIFKGVKEMTAEEISKMSFTEKALKVFEIVERNSEARKMHERYATRLSVDDLYNMMLAIFTN